MVRFAKLAALTLVVSAPALTLGIAPAKAELCDGTWHTMGNRQMQCYYLPTVSNGSVNGLSFRRNFRPAPGPIVVPHGNGPHHHYASRSK
jgi:hypothetical protein